MKGNKRRTYWLIGTAIFLAGFFVCARFALTKPPPFRFLESAEVVREEEWIENTRLKTGGYYWINGPLADAEKIVSTELPPPNWVEGTSLSPTAGPTPLSKLPEPKPSTRGVGALRLKTVTFTHLDHYVTLLDHPQDGKVKVIIQDYRAPSTIDRIRLWLRKPTFGSK